MSSYASTKIQLNELNEIRRVNSRYIILDAGQLAILDLAPIDVVFAAIFLETILQKSSRSRSFYGLRLAGEKVVLALNTIEVANFALLRASSWEKIASSRGMGTATMALVLDVLQVFGFEPEHDDTPIEPPSNRVKEAEALLVAIGLR